MHKSKLGVLAIITVLLLSFTIAIVEAQYQTEKTTNITISSDGSFNASEPDVGVSYQIQGNAGATGTVTADIYNGNPQPTATIPSGDSLTHFVFITFNMNASDFKFATIVINYSDAEVRGISAPYSIFKYNADTNSYTALTSIVNSTAKTITVTVYNLSDPLFAIGGATATISPGSASTPWVLVAVSGIIIVLAAVFLVIFMRRRSGKS